MESFYGVTENSHSLNQIFRASFCCCSLRFKEGRNMRNISVFVFLLLILHPVGGQLSGLTLLNFIQYDVEVIWTQAQSICREKHTDLITIRDEQENQAFFPFQGWIGLYRVNNTSPWKWSRGDKEATFYDWDVDEPDSNQHCGFKDSSKYKWRNRDCDRTYTFTCIDEKLVLVKENKTWEEALEHCRSLGGVSSASGLWIHSYDLATLITEDDRNYAREQAKQATTNEVWMGMRYLGDKWFWVGEEVMQYQDIPSCSAVKCGVLEKNSTTLFGTRDCSQRRNFFCYKRP
ncbi:lymphocyte antigen 75-like [Kryptolebias marmoratus]|uniref:lymphocyte antigen 75-like n=1 Tax=Kryptolebias marmoratus TaxID=37003 RepID=UPI000D52FE54|nr:lymphocyte antigen 75-like [Kryptolebias marmoratus]